MKMSDYEALKLLEKYKIPITRTELVKNLTQLKTVKMNPPLVFKIDSPDIVHKTDVGCVKIAYSEIEKDKAFVEVLRNAKKVTGDINGVLVQEMAKGLEVIIGAKKDKQFDKVIMFGSGGVFTEVMEDVSIRLIPIDKRDAKQMIKETKISKLFYGYRGEKPVKISKIVKILLAVSKIMQNHQEIRELDINPLFVSSKIVAADARIIKE
jgi:acyl-CoA synthetase (NDP forming)